MYYYIIIQGNYFYNKKKNGLQFLLTLYVDGCNVIIYIKIYEI